MEDNEETNDTHDQCKTSNGELRGKRRPSYSYKRYQYQHHLLQYANQFVPPDRNQFFAGYYPPLLPLPPALTPLQLTLPPPVPQHRRFRSKYHLNKPVRKFGNHPSLATSSYNHPPEIAFSPASQEKGIASAEFIPNSTTEPLQIAKRPDNGGKDGTAISLLANHFLVRFDPSQRIYHYNVEISPSPSKDVARMIKQKLFKSSGLVPPGVSPAFDGRKNIYSAVEIQNDVLEFFITLPDVFSKKSTLAEIDLHDKQQQKSKLFRINMRLVSKFDGKELHSYLSKEADDWVPLPQEYLHALDVVLRENPTERSLPVGRSFYSKSMGGTKEIGGGAVGLRGFFQSLRPTQQGLALNVDFSVTAFHESIGVLPYLEKRLEFLKDITSKLSRALNCEERKEVAKVLRNIRVFVCHRETVQRYRIYGLTEEITENLCFPDRDGKSLRLVNYFKDHYDYDIQFRKLPCLRISRNKLCYLPMELCMICEGQKFLGKLSDDQTAQILKMGCQRPKERKAIIGGVMAGDVGPTSGHSGEDFNLVVSREMTSLKGRVLQPPKLRLGDQGNVRNITPARHDRQWNLLESHVLKGTRIERWALISFGGTPEQKSSVPKFLNQLSHRCERLGIFLSKSTVTGPYFESTQLLSNISLLESKLKQIHRAASNNLQLIICIMERKHKGYADLKRIAETSVGVVTQCCLYTNLAKLNSQFLANLALKINAKVGGCTVALYNPLPSQIPRLLRSDEPAMFMGADVTHPHPLDDFSPSIAAVVGSMNWPSANKYGSRMKSQTHRQEIIQDLALMVKELLDDFLEEVKKLPRRIIFFRDGVSETQFSKVLRQELKSIREACSEFQDYDPLITFAVVQKRHHTRLFPCDQDPTSPHRNQVYDENIPPGTVVDTVITHPKEFDFYLCSHWGVKGTSRPAHYHVLWDENLFTSDELQKLVYNLCYTFVRCTKPVSLVPPVYYAHLAAYRGRLYLERSSESARSLSSISRTAPPEVILLPKLNDNVKKLMFYC